MSAPKKPPEVGVTIPELALFRALIEQHQWPGVASKAVADLLGRLPEGEVALGPDGFKFKHHP